MTPEENQRLAELGRRYEEERRAKRERHKKYDRNKRCLYVSYALAAEWDAKREKRQMSFSSWVVEQVQGNQRDDSPQVEALLREKRALEEQITQMRKSIGEMGLENGQLRDQLKQFESYAWKAMDLHAQKVLRDGVQR